MIFPSRAWGGPRASPGWGDRNPLELEASPGVRTGTHSEPCLTRPAPNTRRPHWTRSPWGCGGQTVGTATMAGTPHTHPGSGQFWCHPAPTARRPLTGLSCASTHPSPGTRSPRTRPLSSCGENGGAREHPRQASPSRPERAAGLTPFPGSWRAAPHTCSSATRSPRVWPPPAQTRARGCWAPLTPRLPGATCLSQGRGCEEPRSGQGPCAPLGAVVGPAGAQRGHVAPRASSLRCYGFPSVGRHAPGDPSAPTNHVSMRVGGGHLLPQARLGEQPAGAGGLTP